MTNLEKFQELAAVLQQIASLTATVQTDLQALITFLDTVSP